MYQIRGTPLPARSLTKEGDVDFRRRKAVPGENIYSHRFGYGKAAREREKANASCSWRCSGTSGVRGKAETEARSDPDKEICHHLSMNLRLELFGTIVLDFGISGVFIVSAQVLQLLPR